MRGKWDRWRVEFDWITCQDFRTHTKETHNSTWHLFRNHFLKAADGDASASESIRLLSDDSCVCISVRTYCSWQRCKEDAEIKRQIREFPQPTFCLLVLSRPLFPMSLNNYAKVFCPQNIWVHNSHALFIPLLSLILKFLSWPLRICCHFSYSIWYLRAHFQYHLVVEAILSIAWNIQISLTKEYFSYFNMIRDSKQVSLFPLFPRILELLLFLTLTWHLCTQNSIYHPLMCRSLLSNCTRFGIESTVHASIISFF